jgi:hypothetical protein
MAASQHTHAPRGGLTRRQALKAALASVSLTLPIGIGLGRGATARAAPGPNSCRKGCLYAADRKYRALTGSCGVNLIWSAETYLLTPFSALKAPADLLGLVSCFDRTILAHKAKSFECNEPNCPNFDPYKENPACEGCPSGKCCTAPSQVAGYACCSVCCAPSGDGCESSSTVCGG